MNRNSNAEMETLMENNVIECLLYCVHTVFSYGCVS